MGRLAIDRERQALTGQLGQVIKPEDFREPK
jgi:hypothetical protein